MRPLRKRILSYAWRLAVLAMGAMLSACARTAPVACEALARPPIPNRPAALVLNERAVAEYLDAADAAGVKLGCWR